MNAKETLMQVMTIDIKLQALELEIEEREAAAERITPVLEKLPVQSSPMNAREDAMIAYTESKMKLEKLARKQIEVKDEIMTVLCRIESKQLFEILYRRYFRFQSWNVICVECHISKSDIFRKHKDALKAYEEACEKK